MEVFCRLRSCLTEESKDLEVIGNRISVGVSMSNGQLVVVVLDGVYLSGIDETGSMWTVNMVNKSVIVTRPTFLFC